MCEINQLGREIQRPSRAADIFNSGGTSSALHIHQCRRRICSWAGRAQATAGWQHFLPVVFRIFLGSERLQHQDWRGPDSTNWWVSSVFH